MKERRKSRENVLEIPWKRGSIRTQWCLEGCGVEWDGGGQGDTFGVCGVQFLLFAGSVFTVGFNFVLTCS